MNLREPKIVDTHRHMAEKKNQLPGAKDNLNHGLIPLLPSSWPLQTDTRRNYGRESALRGEKADLNSQHFRY